MRSNNFSKHGFQDDSAGECLYERMALYVHCMYYSIPFGIGFLGQKFKSNYINFLSQKPGKPFKNDFVPRDFI